MVIVLAILLLVFAVLFFLAAAIYNWRGASDPDVAGKPERTANLNPASGCFFALAVLSLLASFVLIWTNIGNYIPGAELADALGSLTFVILVVFIVVGMVGGMVYVVWKIFLETVKGIIIDTIDFFKGKRNRNCGFNS